MIWNTSVSPLIPNECFNKSKSFWWPTVSNAAFRSRSLNMVEFCIWSRAVLAQIVRFVWPTWGQPGSWRPQEGPTLAPWILLSGRLWRWLCVDWNVSYKSFSFAWSTNWTQTIRWSIQIKGQNTGWLIVLRTTKHQISVVEMAKSLLILSVWSSQNSGVLGYATETLN